MLASAAPSRPDCCRFPEMSLPPIRFRSQEHQEAFLAIEPVRWAVLGSVGLRVRQQKVRDSLRISNVFVPEDLLWKNEIRPETMTAVDIMIAVPQLSFNDRGVVNP